ncbi:MAG: DUF2147 domain-containing protein [Bacteroidales bacterium]|jgi:uncharacterized protein (DUF2147 family)|nr:DUF2147 domain-containing protein [Bacteroidales bacterium]MDN5349925.1 hypothetical protein [Bacteroidales bacterium]
MTNKILTILLSAIFSISAISLVAQDKADRVLGKWLNEEGDAHVEITKSGDVYSGKLVWLKFPTDDKTGKPKLDKKNPDDALKSRPVLGLEMLSGFKYDSDDDEWTDGEIYDPKSGKTYSSFMEFDSDGKLKIRGYIGISLIGRTTYWTAVK